LLPAMLPNIDWKGALLRGRYGPAVAKIVCIRRRPSDYRMRAGTGSSMMALREGQAAC
jgi:hypothetical protein